MNNSKSCHRLYPGVASENIEPNMWQNKRHGRLANVSIKWKGKVEITHLLIHFPRKDGFNL